MRDQLSQGIHAAKMKVRRATDAVADEVLERWHRLEGKIMRERAREERERERDNTASDGCYYKAR